MHKTPQLCIIHDTSWAGKVHPDDLEVCKACHESGMELFRRQEPDVYREYVNRRRVRIRLLA